MRAPPSRLRPLQKPAAGQAGAGLLEVLVALLILSLGLMGSARLHAALHLSSDVARQRSAAVRLAQLDIEGQRAFASVVPAPGKAAYEQVASATTRIESDNTVYTVQRQVVDDSTGSLKFSTVEVRWTDRSGELQTLLLHAGVSGSMPATTGVLAVAPEATAVTLPLGRHPGIPKSARNLGDGRSVWQMAGRRPGAYVFDNRSGDIQARCAPGQPAAPPPSGATAAEPERCEPFHATLLQGYVRFALHATPDATRAYDTPLPFDTLLQLDPRPAADPACELQHPPPTPRPRGESSASAPGGARLPLPSDSADPGVAYACVVPKPESGGWSGTFRLAAHGWTLGTGPSQHRVCRYSADLDHSGSIDRNEEHPARYSRVTRHLAGQNYLVIRGELSCPHSPPPPHNDSTADTVQHQP